MFGGVGGGELGGPGVNASAWISSFSAGRYTIEQRVDVIARGRYTSTLRAPSSSTSFSFTGTTFSFLPDLAR